MTGTRSRFRHARAQLAPTQLAWVAGAKCVQLALWFWAGVSKLNHHFPAVVCVMTSNSPVLRLAWLRKRMYRRYPDDLRPSRLAEHVAHGGTALELAVPLCLALADGGTLTIVGLVLMVLLHTHITSSVPMGVPLEWNVMVVYGAFFLFGQHAAVSPWAVGSWPLAALLLGMLVGLPLFGNLRPRALSFLLSMRYYAGNWAYGVWLFRGDSFRKLERLTKSAPWIYDQLDRFYDRRTAVGLVGKVLAFRLMHLHGRALQLLLPRAVDRVEDHFWADGELVAGLVLGWNFGDGHLHREALLRAVQAQCGWEPGELRCIFVESQPLLGSGLAWEIHDAATGLVAQGDVEVDLHHTVEDTGIVLGNCFREALGNKAGITRYGFWLLPMDETLAEVALDLGLAERADLRAAAQAFAWAEALVSEGLGMTLLLLEKLRELAARLGLRERVEHYDALARAERARIDAM